MLPGAPGILLLAAGNASRFGSAKQRATYAGMSLVRRAAVSALATGRRVVVVTGAHADAVSQELDDLPVRFVFNANWEAGMGESIACGFRHIAATRPATAATLLCLADQPQIGTAQLLRLLAAQARQPDRILAADYGAHAGPPCVFPQRFYAELAALSGSHGARRILARHAGFVDTVAMPEAAVDIDTPADLQQLVASRFRT